MKKLLGLFALATLAFAQDGKIGAGTSIPVRTSERINVNKNDGRMFMGSVDQDVMGKNGRVVIPRGSNAELTVKQLSSNELMLDLESVTIHGQRYTVTADDAALGDGQRDGIGKNRRTAEFVGGGALLGTIIGSIAGGGKGAAIGAAAGAGAGAGTQILTRGKKVDVPAESLLTFRLEKSLKVGESDNGVTRKGHHYHKPKK